MRKKKCILTYARSWIALAATRCLGKNGIYVITGDTERGGAANFSRHSKEQFVYPNPRTDPDGFINKLVTLSEKHSSSDTDLVIMPMYSEVYPIISQQERFKGLAKIVLPPKSAYELVRSKLESAVYCKKIGIRTPLTIVVKSADEFYDLAHNMEYPAFVKIPASSGAVGIHKVSCYSEAVKTFDDMVLHYKITKDGPYPILQAFAGGSDYCSTFLFDHGKYSASMTYRNVFEYPKGKGVGVLRETVKADALEEIGRKLLEQLNWNGVCQIDFRWDGRTEPFFIEINPRFWGGLAQSIESGWKFPVWMFDLAVNGHIELQKGETNNVRTVNPALMTLRILQEFFDTRNSIDLTGRIKDTGKLIKEMRGAFNEYFLWDDPLPILGLIYPLMVYLKHGKITSELLIGENN